MMDKQLFDMMRDRFDGLETRMDKGFTEVKSQMTEQQGHTNERLGSLEKTREQQRGIMIGGGVVVSAVSSFFAWLVSLK